MSGKAFSFGVWMPVLLPMWLLTSWSRGFLWQSSISFFNRRCWAQLSFLPSFRRSFHLFSLDLALLSSYQGAGDVICETAFVSLLC